MFLTVYGTEWPILCWCAVKKLPTHSLARVLFNPFKEGGAYV